jgi:hypothetical protein
MSSFTLGEMLYSILYIAHVSHADPHLVHCMRRATFPFQRALSSSAKLRIPLPVKELAHYKREVNLRTRCELAQSQPHRSLS